MCIVCIETATAGPVLNWIIVHIKSVLFCLYHWTHAGKAGKLGKDKQAW